MCVLYFQSKPYCLLAVLAPRKADYFPSIYQHARANWLNLPVAVNLEVVVDVSIYQHARAYWLNLFVAINFEVLVDIFTS
jgi:hypothetical protein